MSEKVKAYVNFFAAIGTLEKYVELDEKAKSIAAQNNLKIRFNVKGGPDGLLAFQDGKVTATPYSGEKVDIHLYCKDTKNFNDVVDGKGMPIPLKGLFKTLAFMGKPESPFNLLTNEMTSIMRNATYLDGSCALELSTVLSFYAMAAAIAEIGNYDDIGKIAAARIAEGEISLEITGHAYATIYKKDGKLYCKREKAKNPRAFMVFSNLEVAGDLITGKADAMSCLSRGDLIMKGNIPMLDNLNKVLNIVPKYLS